MSATKNKYAKKAKQKSLLGLDSMPDSITVDDTKGSIGRSAWETGKGLVIGAIGGGLAGAAAGKSSLIIGAAVTGISFYFGSHTGAMFGIGMMAANGYQKLAGTVSGTDDQTEGLEGVKERLLTFRDTFSEKLWLDKIIKKKTTPATTAKPTNGLGEVQYFVYPGSTQEQLPVGEVDMSALDQIEKQITQNAEQYSKKQPAKPVSGELNEESINGLLGDEDKIY